VSAKDRTAVLALGGGVALCAVALIAYSQFGEDGQGTRSGPAPQQAHVPRGATKVPAAQAQALSASLIGYVVGGFFLSLAYRDMLLVLLALVAALRKVTLLAERPPTLARHPLTWSS